MYVSVFFFQAEDGIRDLVRSRGLGDVYKSQVLLDSSWGTNQEWITSLEVVITRTFLFTGTTSGAVSYTPLTLPTSDLV